MFNPIPTEDRVCGNCAHWDEQAAKDMRISPLRELRPCAKGAVDNDCGPSAVVLLGPDCNCLTHREEWQASEDYLAARREVYDYDTINRPADPSVYAA